MLLMTVDADINKSSTILFFIMNTLPTTQNLNFNDYRVTVGTSATILDEKR